MDFWDHLMIAATLAVRDSYRDMEKQIAREEQAIREEQYRETQFRQKIVDEFADAVSNLLGVINDVSKRANPHWCPNEIVEGLNILPVYVFRKVLKAQGGNPTPTQSSLIDTFFRELSFGFTRSEFIASLHSNNRVSQKMKELVGISESFSGAFWIAFFKAMYVTKSDERTLSKVIEYFTVIVMRLAVLGDLNERAAISICERFISALRKQIVECRKLPVNKIDIIGELHYFEHLKHMADIAFSIYNAASGPEDIEMETLFPIYLTNLIYELLEMTTLGTREKPGLLDRTMERCSIKLDLDGITLSGFDVYAHMKNSDPLYDLLDQATEVMFIALLGMSVKADMCEDSMKFITASMGFLAGLEKELAAEFPFCGFGRLALKYISTEMEKVRFNT